MNIKDFTEIIMRELPKYMEHSMIDGISFEYCKVLKTNDVSQHGICIRKEGKELAPTIYMEGHYCQYLEGKPISEIVKDVLFEYFNAINKSPTHIDPATFNLATDSKFTLRLLSKRRNLDYLEDNAYVDFANGLVLTMDLYLPDSNGSEWRAKISNSAMAEILDHKGISQEELFDEVLAECVRDNPAVLVPASAIAEDMETRENALDSGDVDELDVLYVLTTERVHYGALAMAYPGLLEAIGEALGHNFYIIPCSVHEVLIIPEGFGISPCGIKSTIREINGTCLSELEILDDNLFYYDNATKEFMIWDSIMAQE